MTLKLEKNGRILDITANKKTAPSLVYTPNGISSR